MLGKLTQKKILIAQLKKKFVDETLKKLKLKKHIMDEAIQDSKNKLYQLHGEIFKYAREKYVVVAIIVS